VVLIAVVLTPLRALIVLDTRRGLAAGVRTGFVLTPLRALIVFGLNQDPKRRVVPVTAVLTPLRALIVFGRLRTIISTVRNMTGLNALTGIDSFWTRCAFAAPARFPCVLTPLRALIVFGPIPYQRGDQHSRLGLNALTGIDSFWT